MKTGLTTTASQRRTLMLLFVGCLLICGCSFQRTAWNTGGRYTAEVKAIDGTYSRVNRNVGVPRESRRRGRISFDDEQALSIVISSPPKIHHPLASIVVVIGESLDEVGVHQVIGGYAQVWGIDSAGDPTTPSVRSDEWTITGTVEIQRAGPVDPPPKRVGNKSIVEFVAGVFNLVVEHIDGDRMVIKDGIFKIEVEATRYKWDPS